MINGVSIVEAKESALKRSEHQGIQANTQRNLPFNIAFNWSCRSGLIGRDA
jgi:hypothetical protein